MDYARMADVFAVEHCRGITKTGHYCPREHTGMGEHEPGVVHYADRIDTPSNTYWFLRLSALALDPSIDEDIPWRRVYRLNMAMTQLARFARIKPPLTSMDRAFVKAGTAGLPNDIPLRRQAYDWARRGPRRQA